MKLVHSLLLAALLPVTGVAQVQNEAIQYLSTPGQDQAWLGRACATSGTLAALGAPYQDNVNGQRAGSVFVFDLGTGQQSAILLANDAGANRLFGISVAMDETLAVVGAPGGQAAYVFDLTSGQQVHRLLPSHGGERFGTSVAIHEDRIVVGAPGEGAGAAYVFDAISGQQIHRLKPQGITGGSKMGESVGIHGDLVIAGAPDSDAFGFSTGSAHLFDLNTGLHVHELLASDATAHTVFGNAVAISAAHILVGSRLADNYGNNSGSAYLFDRQNGYQELALLRPADVGFGDNLGLSVALNSGFALVGAPYDNAAGSNSGSAYLFDLATIQELVKLNPSNGHGTAAFGFSVALSRTTALVGTPWNNQQGFESGTVYRFSLPTQNSGQGFCYGDGSASACPCGASGAVGEGCTNTGGAGARLVGMGGPSLSSDWFMLNVLNLPDQRPGLILRASSMLNGGQGSVIGDGLLCITGQVARSQVVISSGGFSSFGDFRGNPFGMSSYGTGVPTYYQFWYRDATNTCSGSGFNFSNAWTVTWQ